MKKGDSVWIKDVYSVPSMVCVCVERAGKLLNQVLLKSCYI